MNGTYPQPPQSQQRQGYRTYPRYQHGQHVRLPDGTHAQVVAQRGLTLWIRHPDRDLAATYRADKVEAGDAGERLSTASQKPGPRR